MKIRNIAVAQTGLVKKRKFVRRTSLQIVSVDRSATATRFIHNGQARSLMLVHLVTCVLNRLIRTATRRIWLHNVSMALCISHCMIGSTQIPLWRRLRCRSIFFDLITQPTHIIRPFLFR